MKKVVLIKNDESDLLGFYLNLYALKILKTDNKIEFVNCTKEEAKELIYNYKLNEFPVLLLLNDNSLIEKVSGFSFLNKIPVF